MTMTYWLEHFLSTKYVAIPDLLYIQYRNENGDNSTFLRNNKFKYLSESYIDITIQE